MGASEKRSITPEIVHAACRSIEVEYAGIIERQQAEIVRLRAALLGLDTVLGVGGNLNESGCRALREGIAKALDTGERRVWHCTTDGVTNPCGDCDGCRYDQALHYGDNRTGD